MTAQSKAAELGAAAYKSGIMAACHDPQLLELLEGLPVGEGQAIFKAWNMAWHAANIKNGESNEI